MRAALVGFKCSFAVLFLVACGQEQSGATHASTYAAVLGPALGPELFLQDPRTLLPQRNSPSVALGPKGYVVASVDRLTAAAGGIDNSYFIGQYVQVTRLLPDMTVDGDVLRLWPAEPDERPLVTAVGDEFALVSGTKGVFLGFDGTLGATFFAGTAIGSDGNSVVVISPCSTQTSCSLYQNPPLVARNVSRSGTRLKETILEVSEGAGSHSLLWNGSEYLLAWSALGNVLALRLDASGAPIDSSPIVVSNAGGAPAIAWKDPYFLLVWQGTAGLYASRMLADGTVVDPSGIYLSSYVGTTTVSAGETSFLVTVNSEIGSGMRVASDGTLLDPQPFDFAEYGSNIFQYTPGEVSAVSNGSQHLLIYAGYSNRGAVRILDDATVQNVSMTTFGGESCPSVSFGPDYFLTTWKVGLGTWGTRLSPAGTRLEQESIRITADYETSDVRWDGRDFVLLTSISSSDPFSRPTGAYASLVPPDATFASAYTAAWDLTSVPSTVAASDGTSVLFAQSSSPGLERRDLDLATLDPALVPLIPDACVPRAVTWDGSMYAVLCSIANSETGTDAVYAVRISAAGAEAAYAQLAEESIREAESSSLSSLCGSNDFVTASGAGVDAFGWTRGVSGPRVELRTTNLATNLASILLTPTGTLQDISWDGRHFIVVWVDGTNIVAARITPQGTVLDPGGFLVADQAGFSSRARVASTLDGTSAIVYDEHIPLPSGTSSQRVTARFLWLDGTNGGEAIVAIGGEPTYFATTPPVVVSFDAGAASDAGAPTDASADAQSATPPNDAGHASHGVTDSAADDASDAAPGTGSEAPRRPRNAAAAPQRVEVSGGCSCEVRARTRETPTASFALVLLTLSAVRRRRSRPCKRWSAT